MPYIGKPQSADPITVNSSNITDASIANADLSPELTSSISGSFSKEHLGAKVANVVTSSAQIAADISGSFGNQRVGTSDSPTFAGGTITGDFSVGGTLTAQEIHTEFESASIIFTSGSTIFGDTSDDIHNMTGSLNVSGAINLNDGDLIVTDNITSGNVGIGETSLDGKLHIKQSTDNGNAIVVDSGTDGARIDVLTVQEAGAERWNLSFEGDSSTNDLTLNSNSTNNILNIKPGGNVGIGTNNPGSNLVVSSSTKTDVLFGGNSSVFSDTNRSNVEINGQSTSTLGLTIGGAAKGLLFHDGTDSYFRNYANGYFAIYTNNSEKVRVDNSGNVGIGTNNLGGVLHVRVGSDQNLGFNSSSNVFRLSAFNDAVNANVPLLINASSLRFGISDSEKVRIDSSGNVGIGTATPVSGGLHIHTDASTEGIYLKSEGDTRNNLVFDSNISSAADNIAFIDANWNETNVARISMFTGTDTSNQDDGRIGFATAAAGTVAERMRIESDGSVGIHTTSPNVGGYNSERGVLTIGSTDNGSANNYAVLELQGHAIANNVTIGDISWYDHTNYNAIVRGGRDSSTTTGFLAFFTNGGSGVSERMRIDKDGHVEINDGNLVIGTSGHGIDFSATSNATGMSSELLDDYEEGVYDITIGGLGGGSVTMANDKNQFSYTKIGRQVTVQGEISITGVSSQSGTMTINLPFSVGSTIGDLSSRTVGSFSSQNHNYHDLSLTIHSHTYEGQSVMYFVYHKDNAGWEYVNTNTLASNTEFRVSLTYFTN